MGTAQGSLRNEPILQMEHINSEEAVDFECPICFQSLERPVKTQCGHVFCQECHSRNFHASDGKCPICRKDTSFTEQRAMDIEEQMMTKKANCRGCDTQVCLMDMRAHTQTCSKYLEEYGPALDAYTPPQPTPASYSTIETIGWTFTCPYCQEANYDVEDLVTHCCTHHSHDYRRVVCPICALMPWGDPNYYSRNFLTHLRLRHQFDYEHFVDFSQDEELMLQDTILNSFQDCAQIPF
ncbi:E3 ubiquitin-protein ligase RNF114 [Mustelus asterias]